MKYVRSPFLNYYELNDAQKSHALEIYGPDEIQETTFVLCPLRPDTDVISTGDFLRIDAPGRWDGVASLSAFSAYLIKIGSTGEEATIAYFYC